MKVIEFHPDDLLDRELAGALSAEERVRLDEHLTRCAACRLERQLRADFDAELAPQSEPRDVQLFVSGAMQVVRDRQFDPPTMPQPSAEARARAQNDAAEARADARNDAAEARTRMREQGEAPRARTRRRRSFLIALAATLTLGAGLALGQEGWAEEAWRAVGDRIGSAFQTLPAAPRAPKQRTRTGAVTPAKPQIHAVEAREQGDGDAPGAREQGDLEAPSARRAPIGASDTMQALPSEGPSRSDPQSAARALPERARAALLFEQANSARRTGDALQAGVYYRELQTRFPKSAEARLSLALVARMQLDRGEHAPALGGFEAYLATGDRALREEAMAGRALTLAQLGRTRASEQAFEELLRAYPDSAYGVLARRHLRQESP